MTALQALADERKTLLDEYDEDSTEIARLISHRFEKLQAIWKVEAEMRAIGKDLEP